MEQSKLAETFANVATITLFCYAVFELYEKHPRRAIVLGVIAVVAFLLRVFGLPTSLSQHPLIVTTVSIGIVVLLLTIVALKAVQPKPTPNQKRAVCAGIAAALLFGLGAGILVESFFIVPQQPAIQYHLFVPGPPLVQTVPQSHAASRSSNPPSRREELQIMVPRMDQNVGTSEYVSVFYRNVPTSHHLWLRISGKGYRNPQARDKGYQSTDLFWPLCHCPEGGRCSSVIQRATPFDDGFIWHSADTLGKVATFQDPGNTYEVELIAVDDRADAALSLLCQQEVKKKFPGVKPSAYPIKSEVPSTKVRVHR